VIVSFPNFGHWKIRLQILLNGRMPMTWNLPESWYETPNIHFCTIRDFRALCELVGARMERAVALSPNGHPLGMKVPPPLVSWTSSHQPLMLLSFVSEKWFFNRRRKKEFAFLFSSASRTRHAS